MPERVRSHFETGWRLFKSHVRIFVVSMLLLFLSWVGCGRIPALRKAAALARGNWLELGALFLIALLLNLTGAVVLGAGIIVSFPVSLLAIAGFSRSLQPATV
jgi:hypothetical protein